MVKTTVYIETDTALALRYMAQSEGRPQAALIRDALRNYTSRGKRPLPRCMGKYDSGETYGAERAKDFLRQAAKKRKWR